jgi:hypothetical protein
MNNKTGQTMQPLHGIKLVLQIQNKNSPPKGML